MPSYSFRFVFDLINSQCADFDDESLDIKPQNILIETAEINEIFENAPSEVFLPQDPPPDPPNNFYIQSSQISSADEDLSRVTEVSVRLADFGTGEKSRVPMIFSPINSPCSELVHTSSHGVDTASDAPRP